LSFDLHGASEVGEASHEAMDGLGLVAAIEVVWTEVAVVDAVAEHVKDGGKHGSSDREDGLLGAATGLDP
jgi:hypothetical protein